MRYTAKPAPFDASTQDQSIHLGNAVLFFNARDAERYVRRPGLGWSWRCQPPWVQAGCFIAAAEGYPGLRPGSDGTGT